jgi:hypothetical protein
MLLVLLTACVHLEEGDYDLDYDPPDVDSCNLMNGAALPDDGGELSWDGESFTVRMDSNDSDLEFDVDGKDFDRDTSDRTPLDDSCMLAASEEDEGEITSATSFEGTSSFTYTLEGSCIMWEMVYDTPCVLEFDWEADYDD